MSALRYVRLGPAHPAPADLLESAETVVRTGDDFVAVANSGRVVAWNDDAAKWRVVLGEEAESAFQAPIQIVTTAWGGVAHAVSNDGAVFRLDGTARKQSWTKVLAKTERFGARLHPLYAFDPERGVLVVWGDQKKSGDGRKDETFVCDGKSWTEAKKSKTPPDDDVFALFFEPNARQIARLSDTGIDLFDGTSWSNQRHGGIARRSSWGLSPCVAGEGPIVFIGHHAADTDVLRMRHDPKKGYTFEKAAKLTQAVKRDGNWSHHGNQLYDAGWFDPSRRRLVCHCEDDDTTKARGGTFTVDLAPLFAR